MNINTYARLMRLDKPIGIFLLGWPTAWALWLARTDNLTLALWLIFISGTVIMRSAGCVMNDIADRKFDKYVQRTAKRPLASGEVSFFESLILLGGLLFLALGILLCLPASCFFPACLSVLISMIYPFCKRWLSAPQLVLGVAFSMGIPMAYLASNHAFDGAMIGLFLINFVWIVAYDTLYAMVDKADDLKIGIQSTAIMFGQYDKTITTVLQFMVQGAWGFMSLKTHFQLWFWLMWGIALVQLMYQQYLIYVKQDYFKAFLSNATYGCLLFLSLL